MNIFPSVEDFNNYYVIPGLIELNANLQNSEKEKWEGFDFGTAAAASGGVTTIVDHPIMKKPSLTNIKNLKIHCQEAQNKLKIDIALLAYLNDLNLSKIEKFIKDGTIFGFSSSLSTPLNRKLDEITEKGLTESIGQISKFDSEIVYFIEALVSEGRHMFAKSPFRKEKLKQRLQSEIPKTLDLMGFAFPDGNEGDNSSASEDEAKPSILMIERLDQKSAGVVQGKTFDQHLINSHQSILNRFEEPSSAIIREQIGNLRQDVQNLAVSELMLYETTSSGGNIHSSTLLKPSQNRDEESPSSEENVIPFQVQPRHQPIIKQLDHQKNDYSLSISNLDEIKPEKVEEHKLIIPQKIEKKNTDGPQFVQSSLGQVSLGDKINKKIKIQKIQIDFGAQPRINSQEYEDRHNNQQKSIKSKPIISENQEKVLEKEQNFVNQVTEALKGIKITQENEEQGVIKEVTLKAPIKRNTNTLNLVQKLSLPSKLEKSISIQESDKDSDKVQLQLQKEPSNDEDTTRKSLQVNDSKRGLSPLMGGLRATSFVERRKQIMAQKMSGASSPCMTPAKQESTTKLMTFQEAETTKNLSFPQKNQFLNPFGIKLMVTSNGNSDSSQLNQQQQEGEGDNNSSYQNSPQLFQKLKPLNTKKQEENDDAQTKLMQNYKFFLSLQSASFEENGVQLVEKIINQMPDFAQKGCKIHFMNLSSNIGLDKVRQVKKSFQNKITTEITPHHLMFSAQDIPDKETIMKCSPPIRDIREQTLLQISFKKKYFDVISSQHFPVDPIYKQAGGGNFFKAFNGVSTLGFTLQAMWTLYMNSVDEKLFKCDDGELLQEQEKNNYITSLIKCLCEQPAQVLGISKQKGSLEKGKQADFVVFDSDFEGSVSEKDIYSRYPEVSIYKGKHLNGRVKKTYLRGKLIYCDVNGNVLKQNCFGKVLLRREFK